MKKILMTLIILLFASSFAMAAQNFSADAADGGGGPLTADPNDPTAGSGSVEIVKPSNNVFGIVVSGPSSFSAGTLHMNGTFQYCTSSEDTKIYRTARADDEVGTATFVLEVAVSDTSEFADWNAL